MTMYDDDDDWDEDDEEIEDETVICPECGGAYFSLYWTDDSESLIASCSLCLHQFEVCGD